MTETTDSTFPASSGHEDEVMVCPDCLAACPSLADFCDRCGRPLSCLATMDPIKSIYAQGWLYRKAISGWTSRFILLGMWLVFGPGLITIAVSLIGWAGGRMRAPPGWSSGPADFGEQVAFVLSVFAPLAMAALYAAILYRVTRSYLNDRQIGPGCCIECGYNLTGLSEARCPECARPFHPEDVAADQSELETPSEDEGTEHDEAFVTTMPGRRDRLYAYGVAACYLLTFAAAWFDGTPAPLCLFLWSTGAPLVLGAVALAATLLLSSVGLAFALDSEHRGSRSPLFWCAVPAILLLLLFVGSAALTRTLQP